MSVGADQQPTASFVAQWLETIQRDYSHPRMVGRCSLNETRRQITDRITTLDNVTCPTTADCCYRGEEAPVTRARMRHTVPNIVVIAADDMEVSDIGCFKPESATVNLVSISRAGPSIT